jgi:hypothetical protein
MRKYRWKKHVRMRARTTFHQSNAKEKEVGMAPQDAFDPHTFLAKVGTGQTLVACPKQSPIF